MSSEITVRSSLQVTNDPQDYQSRPTVFVADQATRGGPAPGALVVPTYGLDVDFSGLPAPPGMCRLMNLDSVNKVHWGVFDRINNEFIPVGTMLPGETFILRLASHFGEEYIGLGTGSGSGTGPHSKRITLQLRSENRPCNVLVEAFCA